MPEPAEQVIDDGPATGDLSQPSVYARWPMRRRLATLFVDIAGSTNLLRIIRPRLFLGSFKAS